NEGAAQRGLSSLSGLLQQVSAQWTDFLQRVADNGVTDYFKRQMESLLASAGGMDALAKKVAAGIVGVLEAFRKLGAQLAPVAGLLGNLTLTLARHAEGVMNLVKAWALFRAAEIALGFT